jgi:hypothetical protein
MFRHVVMFRWTDATTDDDVAAMASALAGLPAVIPEIRRYEQGPDAGINDGNFDYAIVADFDAVDGYLVYRDHPMHQQMIADLVRPIMAERVAVQYEVPA